ncbi:TBCD protein [Marasmius fiardii PR-910]|nr:TBCD protein [Marasmius fiardii PR-910]
MDDEHDDQKQFTSFEKYQDFLSTQEHFLKTDLYTDPSPEDDREEWAEFTKLTNILLEYQEQSYLLDPFLERLVTPVLDRLRAHAKDVVLGQNLRSSSARLERITRLLYGYIKFRGYKAIIRFFPHEVSDLSIVVGYMNTSNILVREPTQWALRYVFLLWLSLICMIPFDLAQFDEGESGQTAATIENIAKEYLGKAGLEREGAALLLSRLYMRQDTLAQFVGFLEWSNILLTSTLDPFIVTGILQVLAEILKSGPAKVVQLATPEYWSLNAALDGHASLLNNTVVRKIKMKIASRVGLRLLPGKRPSRRVRGRSLAGENIAQSVQSDNDDIDVPEEEEAILEQLFSALQDRDTVVRYSAAKGVARISERLPPDFTEQVLDTVLGLFTIHSVAAATLYDISPIAESTWHGACLSCAEMARRGLVPPDKLPELLRWLSKALYFDIRKGAHSVGSNVRDASAYVLWALARSQNPSDLIPHANDLARHLVTVSLYDREVHIRRAASAAFQEFVGRTSLFPHGIDVLGKTDFYSVGVRRNSFLVTAPQVALHEEYTTFLFDHLLNVTLRHWDATMRRLASQSLRLICLRNLAKFGPEGVVRATKLMDSADISDLHGSLLALAETAKAYEAAQVQDLEAERRNIFAHLSKIPEKTICGARNEILLAAACALIEATITSTEINLLDQSSVPHWRNILNHGLKHREVMVQEAATSAMGGVSNLVDCSTDISRLIPELKRGSFMAQQCVGRLLGVMNYERFPNSLNTCVETLLNCVDRSSGPFRSNVEARRNCYLAIPSIFRNVSPRLSSLLDRKVVNVLFDALLDGLTDYSVDERGDVGSWVRIACLRGLNTLVETVLRISCHLSAPEEYLSSAKFQKAIQGILKQGVERLDNVRSEAGQAFRNLLSASSSSLCERWRIHRAAFLTRLFLEGDAKSTEWSDASWLFPRAVQILGIESYRLPVLLGIISSIGSLTDSTHRPAANSLVAYIRSLPIHPADPNAYDAITFVKDLYEHASANMTSNIVMLPVLQVLNVLLEGDAFRSIVVSDEGVKILRLFLSAVCKNAERLKNVRRIQESLKVAVNCLVYTQIFDDSVRYIPRYLAHQYPTVRANAAEFLFLALQRMDLGRETDEAEELILETEWSSLGLEDAKKAAQDVIEHLK